jgi:anti-sigma regulatory factor (Ser/Thr protein kinase)
MRMPSRREAVGPTVDRILRAIEPAGLSAGQKEDLAVAVAEALSNAAVHGNRLRARSVVSVIVDVIPGVEAVVEVKDGGRGFNANDLEDPTEANRIMVPGGRGVFLRRRLTDAMEYHAPGNRVRLTKRAR